MEVINKIDMYLNESKKAKVNEVFDISGDPMLAGSEAMSFSTGLRRIALYFQKANTPRKYAIAFEMANDMVQKFPLKAKIVLSAVADAYQKRFGSIVPEG